MLVLIVGDLHIPQRAADIPAQFKQLFVPGRINCIVLTGNVTSKETIEYFRCVCSEIHCARGEFDDYAKDIPEYSVFTVEGLTFGVIHGHQVVPWGDKEALASWQRRLGVDVLISGHTHIQKMFEIDGKFYVNPGSITGAFSPFESDVTPSFVLMDVADTSISAFIYQIEGTEMKVKKKEWKKP